jgi:uncharacterized repeat protein (TIGR04138 family)
VTPMSEFWEAVERIRSADGRYGRDAYAFVMEALDVTVRDAGERRHVSASELIDGLVRYARARYGMMAYSVVRAWGLGTGSDVGEIVFQLIDAGILSKRDEDTREDFDVGVNFKRVLEDEYFDASAA